MTPMMQADEIAHAFNCTVEREYWKAAVAGTRALPLVNFNSRATMVQLTYYPQTGQFSAKFSKTACSFGDFIAALHRSLWQVLTALRAAGLDVQGPLEEAEGALRMEYDPATKQAWLHFAKVGDDWREVLPLSFKGDVQNILQAELDTR